MPCHGRPEGRRILKLRNDETAGRGEELALWDGVGTRRRLAVHPESVSVWSPNQTWVAMGWIVALELWLPSARLEDPLHRGQSHTRHGNEGQV